MKYTASTLSILSVLIICFFGLLCLYHYTGENYAHFEIAFLLFGDQIIRATPLHSLGKLFIFFNQPLVPAGIVIRNVPEVMCQRGVDQRPLAHYYYLMYLFEPLNLFLNIKIASVWVSELVNIICDFS